MPEPCPQCAELLEWLEQLRDCDDPEIVRQLIEGAIKMLKREGYPGDTRAGY